MFFKNGPQIQSAVRTVRSAVRTFCADWSILDPSRLEDLRPHYFVFHRFGLFSVSFEQHAFSKRSVFKCLRFQSPFSKPGDKMLRFQKAPFSNVSVLHRCGRKVKTHLNVFVLTAAFLFGV